MVGSAIRRHLAEVDHRVRLPNCVLDELAKDGSLGVIERGLYLLACGYDPSSIADLARLAGMDRGAASRACRNLEKRGWMKMVTSKTGIRPAPLIPRPCQIVMVNDLENEYDLVTNKGEFLMNKRLDWSLRNDEYIANARPEFLKNPQTKKPFEYDRLDLRGAFAGEFNGTQHYQASKEHDQEDVDEQNAHDLMKESLSSRNGITLLTFTWRDLRPGVLESRLDEAVSHLKRGYVDCDGPYMKALNRICDNYASKAERSEKAAQAALAREAQIRK